MFASASLAGPQESADRESHGNGKKRLFAQDAGCCEQRQIGLHLRAAAALFLKPAVSVLQGDEDGNKHQGCDDQRPGDCRCSRDGRVANTKKQKGGCEGEDIGGEEQQPYDAP